MYVLLVFMSLAEADPGAAGPAALMRVHARVTLHISTKNCVLWSTARCRKDYPLGKCAVKMMRLTFTLTPRTL